MPPLYRWEPGQDDVSVTPQNHSFLKAQAAALELIANFYWAEFLEGCNRLAPRIVQKVSRGRLPQVSAEIFEDPARGVEVAMLLL